MGITLKTKSKDITVAGQDFCVGTSLTDLPFGGTLYRIGLFVKNADGSYNNYAVIKDYMNVGELLADVQAKGGRVKFLSWLLGLINAALKTLKPTVVVSTEPSTDQEAQAIIDSFIAALNLGVVDNTIVAN